MNRRRFIAILGITAIAGCSGGDDSGTEEDTVPQETDSPTSSPKPVDTTVESGGEDSPTPTESPTEEPTDTPTQTETPTETPTDTPASTEPDPLTYSGSGQEVIDDVDIIGGLTIVEATHDGESNFAVEFVPSEGEYNELFVNRIGSYEGATAELIDSDTYQIDVTADGDWSLTVRQPRPASGESLPQSLDSDKPEVHGPFEFDGTHTATGEHDGDSNFAVRVFPPEGSFAELVFNEIGNFEGETTFRFDGVGFVDIEANGAWSLEME